MIDCAVLFWLIAQAFGQPAQERITGDAVLQAKVQRLLIVAVMP